MSSVCMFWSLFWWLLFLHEDQFLEKIFQWEFIFSLFGVIFPLPFGRFLYKVKKFYLSSLVLDHSLVGFSREFFLVAHMQFYDRILNKNYQLRPYILEFIFLFMIES